MNGNLPTAIVLAALATVGGRRHGRGRAQPLQLGQLHQPRVDREVREGPRRQGHDHRLRVERPRHSPRSRPAVTASTWSCPRPTMCRSWIERRPVAGDACRPDGQFQARQPREVADVPPGIRAAAIQRAHGSGARSVSRSTPSVYDGDINTSAIMASTRPRSWSARSMSRPEMQDVIMGTRADVCRRQALHQRQGGS